MQTLISYTRDNEGSDMKDIERRRCIFLASET